ncbi:MAG: exonuclease SbcCD subunit D C-terminal domain-containing protein [Bacteroidaceae bacterium]
MKILHTADWHIGQIFHGYDRMREHAHFFAWLLSQLKEKNIDVMLVAGDIFDVSNPSGEAQRMYYNFLVELHRDLPDLQVIIIAGNHDSAAKLEAPKELLQAFHVHVIGKVRHLNEHEMNLDDLIIPLHSSDGAGVVCLALPYVRQGDYPLGLSYEEGIKELYKQLALRAKTLYPSADNLVAMGHLYASGAEIAENDHSERISVGGLDCVDFSDYTSEISYLALGHIHRAQKVAHNDRIRYAGSPLPMSFTELNYKHGVELITLEDGETTIEKLSYEPLVKLMAVPEKYKPLDEVLAAIAHLPDAEQETPEDGNNNITPFVEVRVLTEGPQLDLAEQVRVALEGKKVRLCSIKRSELGKEISQFQPDITLDDLRDPKRLAIEYWKKTHADNEMPDELLTLFLEVSQKVINEGGSAQ